MGRKGRQKLQRLVFSNLEDRRNVAIGDNSKGLFKKIYFIYLKGKARKREKHASIFCALVHSLNGCRGRVGQAKPGACSFIQVYHVVHPLESSSAVFPGALTESWSRSNSWGTYP